MYGGCVIIQTCGPLLHFTPSRTLFLPLFMNKTIKKTNKKLKKPAFQPTKNSLKYHTVPFKISTCVTQTAVGRWAALLAKPRLTHWV